MAFYIDGKEATMGGNLFKAEQARNTKGTLGISLSGYSAVIKRIKKLENGAEIAVQRTVSDFSSRAPAWVSQGIREHYGVDKGAITEAAKKKRRGTTSIKVTGISVDGVELVYQGRTLTPTHFKMSPKTPPTARLKIPGMIPGQAINTKRGGPVAMVRPPKPYAVKATIIKGQRSTLPAGTFVAEGKGGSVLPFQRTSDGRMPIEGVRTLSVPQMIEGRAHDTIEQTINEKLGARLEHHLKQATK